MFAKLREELIVAEVVAIGAWSEGLSRQWLGGGL